MTADSHRDSDFHDGIIALLPRLRGYAMALTRSRADADDLLQTTIANALAAQDSFTPGTNLHGWLNRIMRNRFVSDLRRRRETGHDLDELPPGLLAREEAQEHGLVLRELHRALGRLAAEQREALLMVVLEGASYEQVAERQGCAIGTAKSRVFRTRRMLKAMLLGEVEVELGANPAEARVPLLPQPEGLTGPGWAAVRSDGVRDAASA